MHEIGSSNGSETMTIYIGLHETRKLMNLYIASQYMFVCMLMTLVSSELTGLLVCAA